MASFHQTLIVGNLGRDPETRYLPNGDAVCNFSVAVTEKWKKDGEAQERTTWYRVNAFRKLAEICGEYLKKGSSVMIVGKMGERKWTDKDGAERSSWELTADSMQMLGGKHDGGRSDGAPPSPGKQAGGQQKAPGDFDDNMDSDIPF